MPSCCSSVRGSYYSGESLLLLLVECDGGGYRFWADPEIIASVTGPNELSIADLNELPEPAARRVLASCCSAGSWVDAIVGGRGYASIDEVLARSHAAVAG